MPRNSTVPCTLESPNVVKDGCLPHLQELVMTNAYTIACVGIGIALIQVSLFFFEIFKAQKFRKETSSQTWVSRLSNQYLETDHF